MSTATRPAAATCIRPTLRARLTRLLRGPKIGYMTIDDGPTAGRRRRVDVLADRGIEAVWFSTGREMEARPDDAIYTIERGGILGNHSWSHPHFSRISVEECCEEIRRTDALIDDLYRRARVERPFRAFRFPFGDKGGSKDYWDERPYSSDGLARKNAIQAFLRELGYTQPRWDDVTFAYYDAKGLRGDADWFMTYDAHEWSILEPGRKDGIDTLDDVLARMEEHRPQRYAGLNDRTSADIVLIHDQEGTTDLFEPIVDRMLRKGVEFKPIPRSSPLPLGEVGRAATG